MIIQILYLVDRRKIYFYKSDRRSTFCVIKWFSASRHLRVEYGKGDSVAIFRYLAFCHLTIYCWVFNVDA